MVQHLAASATFSGVATFNRATIYLFLYDKTDDFLLSIFQLFYFINQLL
jgi:hypothetical protein